MTSFQTVALSRGVADAYDDLADAYDVLTTNYCHDRWLERIERLALAHGLRGRRLLDIACGTVKSFLPLAQRGYGQHRGALLEDRFDELEHNKALCLATLEERAVSAMLIIGP